MDADESDRSSGLTEQAAGEDSGGSGPCEPGGLVEICHTRAGEPPETIRVACESLPAHLARGDTLCACEPRP